MVSLVITKCLITVTIITILSVAETNAQASVRTSGSFNRNFAGRSSLNNNANAIRGGDQRRNQRNRPTQAALRPGLQGLGTFFGFFRGSGRGFPFFSPFGFHYPRRFFPRRFFSG
ncbi:hypothetical protein LOAG_13927 [Loa loa]|uniref:Uncharacterized protein n=1 Tax=Loa loa TaxID=7209 RepID=A0A1S0TJ21_LOALO|nr:hypothetical protein LOAG_13927 [Loa loa]EFO14590.1 hypothetical protein LOAG_13927 [Loa loa]